MKDPDRRSRQKVPDWEKVMSNIQGARSENVMELQTGVILLDLQSRRDGVCVGLYLH